MKSRHVFLPLALAATALAAAPVFAAGVPVRKIVIENRTGAIPADWSALSSDLQQALAAQLGNKMSSDGYDLRVRVTADQMPTASSPGKLAGTVLLVMPARPTGNGDASSYHSVMKSYDLTVSPKAADGTQMASADQNAMVSSFASYVAAHL